MDGVVPSWVSGSPFNTRSCAGCLLYTARGTIATNGMSTFFFTRSAFTASSEIHDHVIRFTSFSSRRDYGSITAPCQAMSNTSVTSVSDLAEHIAYFVWNYPKEGRLETLALGDLGWQSPKSDSNTRPRIVALQLSFIPAIVRFERSFTIRRH